MLEIVDWETFCPETPSSEHCICFYKDKGDGKLECCECKREATVEKKDERTKQVIKPSERVHMEGPNK